MREVGGIEVEDTLEAVGVTVMVVDTMAAVGTEVVDTMEAIGVTTVMAKVTMVAIGATMVMAVDTMVATVVIITAGQLE